MLKRMGTKLVIINLTIAMVFSNAVEAWALRPPSAVESSKKKNRKSPFDIPLKPEILKKMREPEEGMVFYPVVSDFVSDLDTVASAVAEAYKINMKAKKDGVKAFAFPVIQGEINDETRFILRKIGIDPANLIFLNEVEDLLLNLTKQKKQELLRIVLTDHSKIQEGQNQDLFNREVDTVIDHHPISDRVNPQERVQELVGATSTLIFERLSELGKRIPENLSLLMLAAILSDTKNLVVNAQDRDRKAAEKLKENLGYSDEDQNKLFTAQTHALNTINAAVVSHPLDKIFNPDNQRYFDISEERKYSFSTFRLNHDEKELFANLLPEILNHIQTDMQERNLEVAFFNVTHLTEQGGLSDEPEELYVIGSKDSIFEYKNASGISGIEELKEFEAIGDIKVYKLEHRGAAPRKKVVSNIMNYFAGFGRETGAPPTLMTDGGEPIDEDPVRGAAAVPPITGGSGVPQILVLSNNVSLLEGAQTGAYPFEAAFQDGARGFILNHSERRGRLENKMENMLRATRDLIRSRGASNEAVKNNWVKTLKTENLPDKEIEAIYSVFFDYFWTRIRMLDEQDNVEVQDIVNSLARRLVNKIINAQLKKDIAYSDKYPIFQTVLCVGETEAQYNAKRTQEILNEDLNQILEGITQEDAQKIGLRIAYEPRWAIGTGLIPPLEEIQATHRFIKETLAKVIGQELEVDYGGSLSEKNKEILALADVDGGLIGTAAKTPEAIEPVIDEAIVQSEKKGRIMNIGMNWKAEHASTGLSPLDAFVELFRTKDLSRVQIAIGTPTVKLVRDRMTELEKEINAQRKKDIPRTRVAINGFGRIGKLVLKAFLENPDNRFEIVAINDLDAIENLAHLFRHDSTFGEFKGDVGVEGDNLIIDDQRIKVLNEKDPAKLPWKDLGIEIVIEASGRFTKREGASKHLEAGAKKVVITAPGEDEDLTVVLGVNEDRYNPQKHQVISNASCTTNCLAPVVKVLKETFGIKSGSMLTVHAATNDQNVLDTVHSDQRRARATLGNIIPTSTGAAKAIGKVIPELQGRLDGLAMRVPTSDVSAVYLDVLLERDTTKEEVNAALKKAAEEGPLSKYLGYTEESLVSSDFLRSSKSGTVDASLTKVINKRIASVVIWYDNEWGYSNRTVQLVNYMLSRAEEQRQEKEGEGKGTETVAVDRLTKLQSDMIAKHIAKALNINTQEALAFVKAETDIYVTNGGGTFLDFIDSLRSSLDFESKEIKGRALIVGPDFFRRGGLTHGLRAVALLSKAVKLAVYGENAQRLKILMGNENIVSASTLDTALKELENKYGISPKDTVLLHSPQETLDEGALKAMNARQIVAPEGIPATLALSKALKELLGEVVAPAFEELLKDMAEAGVIEQKSLNENRQALLAMLEEGQTFAFSEDLKTTEEVAKDAEVVRAKETIKDFMNKHI